MSSSSSSFLLPYIRFPPRLLSMDHAPSISPLCSSQTPLVILSTSHPFSRLFPPRFQSARTSLSSSPHPPTGPQGCLVTMTTELLKAEVKDLVAMASASPPPAPPARLAALRLRSTQREGPRSRGGASSEREGSRRKDKKGSGAGAYGGRRGTRRAGGCRMVGCAKEGGEGEARGVGCTCGGPWGPPSVGAALSSSGPQRPSLTWAGGRAGLGGKSSWKWL